MMAKKISLTSKPCLLSLSQEKVRKKSLQKNTNLLRVEKRFYSVIARNRLRFSYITIGGFFLYHVPGFLPAAKQLSAATNF